MSKCDNCATDFDPTKEGLETTHCGRKAASICGGCCENVRVGKLALRRGDVGGFAYEQWSPVEMMGGGLTSKRAG